MAINVKNKKNPSLNSRLICILLLGIAKASPIIILPTIQHHTCPGAFMHQSKRRFSLLGIIQSYNLV